MGRCGALCDAMGQVWGTVGCYGAAALCCGAAVGAVWGSPIAWLLCAPQNPEQSADEDEEKKSRDSEGEWGALWGSCGAAP